MGNYCQSDPVTRPAARCGEMNATILRDEAISIMRRSARSQVLAAQQSASREAAVVSRLRQLLLFPAFSAHHPGCLLAEEEATVVGGIELRGAVLPPDLQLVVLTHAAEGDHRRDAVIMDAAQDDGLMRTGRWTVLGRVACTCRTWARFTSSDELWRAPLYEEIGMTATGAGGVSQCPLRVQMKAVYLFKTLRTCMKQYYTIVADPYSVESATSGNSSLSSLQMLLQQLTLCEPLLTALMDSAVCFDAEVSAWASSDLIANGTEKSYELKDLPETVEYGEAMMLSEDIAPARTASVMLQPVLVELVTAKKTLTSRIDAAKTAHSEANWLRIFGKKSKWPGWLKKKYGVSGYV